MKKIAIIAAMLLCSGAVSAGADSGNVAKFTHQNVPKHHEQTCYSDAECVEKEITEVPETIFGMRINKPIFRAYVTIDAENSGTVEIKAEQYSKKGRLLKTNTVTKEKSVGKNEYTVEFDHVRNAVGIVIYADENIIGSLNAPNDELHLTEYPSDYEIYQRDENNKATVAFAGNVGAMPIMPEVAVKADGTVNTLAVPDGSVVYSVQYDGEKLISASKRILNNGQAEFDTIPIGSKIYVWDENQKPLLNTVTVNGYYNNPGEVVVAVNGKDYHTQADYNGDFSLDIELESGLYDAVVTCGTQTKEIQQFGVGDLWVAAGQSNMTDMGAVCDGFNPDTEDPINKNMHIIYAEDTKWQQMSHPAGEGRFWKNPGRTSPVTSFAREISEAENVPVGIVQSSVGGTNIYQWAKGVKPGDENDGYLLEAMKACFDNKSSRAIKGILWHQGCNDTMTENYAYNYEELQRTIFNQFREFFGEETPIITTQINDAKQDSTASLGYYDAWSYVKDIQRRNPELYNNVYVVGTGALDLGDTIHNSAKSNLSVGGAWAKTALNRVYGKTDVVYEHPTIDTIKIDDEHTISLTFKNVGNGGLFVRNDVKRLGITNGLVTIQLGDLKKEFAVRQGGVKQPVASNSGKGTTLTITDASLLSDGKTVVLKVEEELAGTVAVDCCYGKYFVPSLTDKDTGWSVLAFYNVIAQWSGHEIEPTKPVTYKASETALISQGDITVAGFPNTLQGNIAADTASDTYMYLNKYSNADAYPLMKFDLAGLDTSSIQSAKLRIYTNEINKDRGGNISIYSVGTNWNSASKYSDYAEISKDKQLVKEYSGVNTSTVFPVNNYSDIDVTDYVASLTDSQAAFSAEATQVAVALMSGVNSDNPPELVIQQGKKVGIKYKNNAGDAAHGVNVTISGTGMAEYQPKDFVTDENGTITAILSEGTYKAVTHIGKYKVSENRFTVTDALNLEYVLDDNTQLPAEIKISGGAEAAAAGTVTPAFTAVLYDAEGKVIADGAVWTWSCNNGASVKDGVVTIDETAEADDVITITVSAEFNGKTVTASSEIKVIDITGYSFGNEYNVVKGFQTGNADNTAVGNSGIKVSSAGGNYNCVIIRNSTSANAEYWPFTNGFKAENDAYYLFIGAGGNSNEAVTLKLAKTVKAGKTITIKMAKPKATQKSGTDRTSSNNPLTVSVGSKTIDLQNDYAFDEWKTENIVSDTDVSEITLNLGKWCAVAIESISIDGGDIPVVTQNPNATPKPEKIKIMPLGDSITNGFTVPGAYRNELGKLLTDNGLSEYVDFVGSQNTGSGYDNDNEGHSGWAIAAIPASGDVEGKGRSGLTTNIDKWMSDYTPDIALLQVGTNDILSLYDLDNAHTRLEALVDKVKAKLPSDGKMYIAKIPYISETAAYNKTGKTQSELNNIVDTYNDAVENIAAMKELTLVDINGCITLSDLQDGIHPNANGYSKMGSLWYSILESEINSRISK